MKKLTMVLMFLLSINAYSQHFRLNEDAKKKLIKIDKELFNKVMFTERFLDEKSDPQLKVIEHYLSTNLNEKQVDAFNELVCLDCYREEWGAVQAKSKESDDVRNGKYDNTHGVDYLKSLNKMDSLQVRNFTDEVNSLTNHSFKFYKDVENSKYSNSRVVYYYPGTYTLEEFDKKYGESGLYRCEECLKFTFSYYYDGANPDLRIKGEKKYRLKEMTAEYLYLFPFWQKYITPDLSAEELLSNENYNAKWYKNSYHKLNIQFIKGKYWIIRNNS